MRKILDRLTTVPKTAWLVLLFIVVLVAAVYSERSNASELYVGLGAAVINQSNTAGEFGYRFGDNNEWDLGVNTFGEGDTKKGQQDVVYAYSFSRIVSSTWYLWGCQFKPRIGIAYVDDSPLVGDTNYRLGLGFDCGFAEIEAHHFSSAGHHDTNTGMDAVTFRLTFEF